MVVQVKLPSKAQQLNSLISHACSLSGLSEFLFDEPDVLCLTLIFNINRVRPFLSILVIHPSEFIRLLPLIVFLGTCCSNVSTSDGQLLSIPIASCRGVVTSQYVMRGWWEVLRWFGGDAGWGLYWRFYDSSLGTVLDGVDGNYHWRGSDIGLTLLQVSLPRVIQSCSW